MSKRDEFLKSQKVLRLATLEKIKLHILFLFGICIVEKNSTLEQTLEHKKQKMQKKKHVAFCVDVGVNAPNIYGVMGQGKANLILEKKSKKIAKKFF